MKVSSIICFTFLIFLFACTQDKGDVPFKPVATCTDGILNGNETAIDCGGTCGDCKEITIPTQGYNAATNYAGYNLAWSDEFEGANLSTSKWGFHIGTGCPSLCGWGNNEEQYFSDNNSNIYQKEGNLIITAKNDNIGGKNYSSSRIHTDNKFEFKYGRVDIRASMPTAPGTWTALFMLNKNYTINNPGAYWPSGGEIDIMEYLGENRNDVMGTGHYGKDWPTNHRYNSVHFSALNNQSFNKVYYVYSIVWEENKITWLINDIVYHTMTPTTTSANGQPYPFNDEFYFVIALSVGGNLPKVKPLAKDFPDSLIIDYVRVYQKK
ncbi:glycoside hydrolase family 16 protein [Flavobacterium sp.]|uniref:glycoside hydrolase family 16 protein n=1 Tax=Flavobacterium sp. TaxID=239 RepID=UPI00286DD744|nr:glycoside hydrolase family 16 protein [Flavobacterium sp.]